jgi:hypothetical protein
MFGRDENVAGPDGDPDFRAGRRSTNGTSRLSVVPDT